MNQGQGIPARNVFVRNRVKVPIRYHNIDHTFDVESFYTYVRKGVVLGFITSWMPTIYKNHKDWTHSLPIKP